MVALCRLSFDDTSIGGGGASVLDMAAADATASSGISSVFEPAALAAVLTSNLCFLFVTLLSLPMMCAVSLAVLAAQLVMFFVCLFDDNHANHALL